MPSFANIETSHLPELAENGGAYTLAEKLHLGELELSSAADRRQRLSELEPDILMHAVVGLNALMRGLPEETGQFEDGQLPMMPTSKLAEKEPLMLETGDTFKRILSNPDLDDAAALRTAGLTLAGAINYIHPFKDGNGRTARLLHYFIEFGAERGEELFEAETYSAIGKVAVVDTDFRRAVDTTPLGGLERSLQNWSMNAYPKEWELGDERDHAALIVRAFLDCMSGKADILTSEEVYQSSVEPGKFASVGTWSDVDGHKVNKGRTVHFTKAPVGTSVAKLYENQYEAMSFAASIPPEAVPLKTNRIHARKKQEDTMKIILPIDLV